MYPDIPFPSLGIVLHSHTALLAVATVAGLAIGYRRTTRTEHLDPWRVCIALFSIGFLAFAGGRLHFVLANWNLFRGNPWSVVGIASASMHAPGAIAAAFVGGAVLPKLLGLAVGRFADGLAPAAAIGIAIARLGCFLNGCCIGELCSLPWGVTLPQGSYVFAAQREAFLLPAGAQCSLPVHPLPLYFAAAALAISLFLVWLRRHRRYPGQLGLLFLVLFSLSSALLEPLRHDDPFRAYGGALPQLLWVNAVLSTLSFGVLAAAEVASRRGTRVPRSPVGRVAQELAQRSHR